MKLLKNRFLLCLLCGLYPSVFYICRNEESLLPRDSAILVLVLCLPPVTVFTALRCYEKIKNTDATRIMAGICLSLLFVYMFSSLRGVSAISGIFSFLSIHSIRDQFIILTIVTSTLCFLLFSAVSEAVNLILAIGLIMSAMGGILERDAVSTGIVSVQAEDITFKNRPNVYYILPDGYQDVNTVEKSFKYDISKFIEFLKNNDFSLYDPFFSNYYSTLNSTTSMLSMSHHYYAFTGDKHRIVGGNNKVVNTFRKNGYEIIYIHSGDYLFLHGSTADVIQPSDSKYLSLKYVLKNIFIGFSFAPNEPDYNMLTPKEMNDYLKKYINAANNPKFFFIYYSGPGHISHLANKPVEYFLKTKKKSFNEANEVLASFIKTILSRDKTAIIMISGDHGTFMYDAPLKSWEELYVYTENSERLRTRFGVLGAIHWPQDYDGRYDALLQSNVNLFRILFAWLARDDAYALNKVPDDCYLVDMNGHKVYRTVKNGELLGRPVLVDQATGWP